MTAYVIMIREKTRDEEALKRYQALAPAARAGHEMEALVRYGALEILEGDPVEGVAMLRFPSMEAAREWYDSPAYQEALKHRKSGSDHRVLIVEGV